MDNEPKKRGRKPKNTEVLTEEVFESEPFTADVFVAEETLKPLPSCKTCVGFKPRKGDDGWCIMLPPGVNGFPVINQDLRCLQHRAK